MRTTTRHRLVWVLGIATAAVLAIGCPVLAEHDREAICVQLDIELEEVEQDLEGCVVSDDGGYCDRLTIYRNELQCWVDQCWSGSSDDAIPLVDTCPAPQ